MQFNLSQVRSFSLSHVIVIQCSS